MKCPFNLLLKNKLLIYRNLLNVLIKIAKEMFYIDKIKRSSNDSKKIWDIIKGLSGNSENKKYYINSVIGTYGVI